MIMVVVTTPFKRKREHQRQSRHQRSCFTFISLGHTRYLFAVFVILCFVIQDVSSMPIPKSTKTPVPHHNNHASSTKTTTPKTPQSHDHGTSQPHHPHHQQQGASSPAKPHSLSNAQNQKLHDMHQWSTQAKPGETAVQKIARESTGHAAEKILREKQEKQQHQNHQQQQQHHQQHQQQQTPQSASPPPNSSKDGHHNTTPDQNPKKADIMALTPQQDKFLASVSRAHQYDQDTRQKHIDSLPKHEPKPPEPPKPEWKKDLGKAVEVGKGVVGLVAPVGKKGGVKAVYKGANQLAKTAGAPSLTELAEKHGPEPIAKAAKFVNSLSPS